jgi:hypothetical protein
MSWLSNPATTQLGIQVSQGIGTQFRELGPIEDRQRLRPASAPRGRGDGVCTGPKSYGLRISHEIPQL